MVELNTLLGLPKDFDVATLKVGETYKIIKDRERAFPLHIAVLMVDAYWNFYGYARVNTAIVKDQKTIFEFEVLSIFSPEEQALYKSKFVEAGKVTGEVN